MKTDFMERIVIRSVPQIVTVKNACQNVTVQTTRNVTMNSAAHHPQKVFHLIHYLILYILYIHLYFLEESPHDIFIPSKIYAR